MIIYHLKKMIHLKSIKTKSKITYSDIVKETGISRSALVRMASRNGYPVTTDTIEKLCKYFGVTCDQLVTFVESEQDLQDLQDGQDKAPTACIIHAVE